MREGKPLRGLFVDAVILTVLLAGIIFMASPGQPYMSDEGNVYLQLEALSDGAWVVDYEYVDLDPELLVANLQRGLRIEEGVVPYVRHPLHALMILPIFQLVGTTGLLIASVFGVVASALLAAALARLVEAGAARPVFWIIGLASPLAFHAHLWLAHSLATAAVAAATLMTVKALRNGAWGWALGAGLAAAIGAGLRSEALFAGPALAAMAGVMWLSKKVPFRRALPVSGLLVLLPAAVWLAERTFTDRTFGSSAISVQIESLSSGLDGVLNAFLITMLYPSYDASIVGWLLVASPLVLWHVGKRAQGSGNAMSVIWVGAGIVVLLVARFLQNDIWPIPGLWVAFPIGVLLMSQVRLRDTSRVEIGMPLGAALLIWIGIIATQYSVGGGLEWGGRYFSILLPLLAPGLAMGIRSVAKWERQETLVRLAAVAVVVLLGIQISTIGAVHNAAEDFIGDVRTAGATVSNTPRGQPVVLAVDVITLTYMTTEAFDEFDWLVAPTFERLPMALSVLDAVDAREVIIVAEPGTADLTGWSLRGAEMSSFNMEVRVYER